MVTSGNENRERRHEGRDRLFSGVLEIIIGGCTVSGSGGLRSPFRDDPGGRFWVLDSVRGLKVEEVLLGVSLEFQ